MSKTKRRESSETEHLRGQVRKLESENRQLKRRVKELDRRAHFYEDVVDDFAEDIQINSKCSACKRGNTIILDLKYVKLETCDSCEHRRKI